ncbi:MAG: hypothetical protein J6L02_06850 [Bacteroidales bacterium]|nr:hypothetical protein [Bacteroidales bacterium]
MKRILLLLAFGIGMFVNGYSQRYNSQINQQRDSFEEFRKKTQSEYNAFKSATEQEFKNFRDSINAEFAKFMERTWTKSTTLPAMKAPETPLPPVIATPEEEKIPIAEPKPIKEETIRVVETKPQKEAPKPITKPEDKKSDKPLATLTPQSQKPDAKPVATPKPTPDSTPAVKGFEFEYYGTPCKVGLVANHKFSLASTDEKSVADAWRRLSSNDYVAIVDDCLRYKERLNLCDWAYLRFVEIMSNEFFGSTNLDEARVMQMFILTQSGYKVRIARGGSRLVLLLPSNDEIYGYSYLTIRGANYYVLDKSVTASSFAIFDHEFPKEQWFAVGIAKEPLLAKKQGVMRYYKSKDDKCTAALKLNKNIIDFYADYPRNGKWNVYSKASLSADVKSSLYPQLKKHIAGKSKADAANILLNFVQTAFKYKTDPEQFGEERPLFADETFYYPYCDCEDRSILYSILVHELLGLDVILLNYPNHIATAVCFGNDDVKGDYFNISGKRYVVCDPTYIGASIGRSMPDFKGVSPKLVTIW